MFFPLIGCIIYLVQNFNHKTTLTNITENLKEIVVSNYKVEQLEKALRFSDTITNKLNLADAYTDIGRYPDAIALYTACLQGFMSDDPTVRMKVLKACFLNGDYDKTIFYGDALEREKSFKNSEERVAYAWATYYSGNHDLAENRFAGMDHSFTNYYHRLEYSKFLVKIDKKASAIEKLSELLGEFEHMKSHERRLKSDTFREVKDLHASLVRA